MPQLKRWAEHEFALWFAGFCFRRFESPSA